jgi:hypothetical protein
VSAIASVLPTDARYTACECVRLALGAGTRRLVPLQRWLRWFRVCTGALCEAAWSAGMTTKQHIVSELGRMV